MLANSFSCPPVCTTEEPAPVWKLVSDSELVHYLRGDRADFAHRLLQTLDDAVNSSGFKLLDAQSYSPEDSIDSVLQQSQRLPIVVVSPQNRQLVGILTAFDLL
jgi:hypothetical protein